MHITHKQQKATHFHQKNNQTRSFFFPFLKLINEKEEEEKQRKKNKRIK